MPNPVTTLTIEIRERPEPLDRDSLKDGDVAFMYPPTTKAVVRITGGHWFFTNMFRTEMESLEDHRASLIAKFKADLTEIDAQIEAEKKRQAGETE